MYILKIIAVILVLYNIFCALAEMPFTLGSELYKAWLNAFYGWLCCLIFLLIFIFKTWN